MNLKTVKDKLIDYCEYLPDLLILAYERVKTTDIWPCGHSVCWCQSITIENLNSGNYINLWFQYFDQEKKVNSGLVSIKF